MTNDIDGTYSSLLSVIAAIGRCGLDFSKVPFFGQPGGSPDDVTR